MNTAAKTMKKSELKTKLHWALVNERIAIDRLDRIIDEEDVVEQQKVIADYRRQKEMNQVFHEKMLCGKRISKPKYYHESDEHSS